MSTTTVPMIKRTFLIQDSPICPKRIPLQCKTIQKRQLSREPGQLVEEDQAPHAQQQSAAENLHSVEVLPKVLVKNHELADTQRCKQERNGESGRIHRQQNDASSNRVASRGKPENCR